jgi:dihydroxy-acid dehydratase
LSNDRVLPSRELKADSVEILAEANRFDALELMAACDKIVPGMPGFTIGI